MGALLRGRVRGLVPFFFYRFSRVLFYPSQYSVVRPVRVTSRDASLPCQVSAFLLRMVRRVSGVRSKFFQRMVVWS